MAESAGPLLGAGNRAHYVFSREVSGGGGGPFYPGVGVMVSSAIS